ncbi:Apq12 family protein [Acetobacter pasteurianus]|nr:Apq12 family protein [Acetobacter pasteurianus]
MVQEILVHAATYAVLALEFVLRNSINLIIKANEKYPDATSTVVIIVGSYISYRVAKRAIRSYISFIYLLVKITCVVGFVAVVMALYGNGLKSHLGNYASQSFFNLLKGQVKPDDAADYLNYMREKFHDHSGSGSGAGSTESKEDIQKLVEEGFNYLQNNVNLEDLGSNLKDILGKFQ